ncbi:MAG: preprotein translocase subunit SecG [Candidatus Thermofonsia Clade 1 bacterium]|jgi:preprotein translocase subunit SecG|uniref:Protein-export membrane protein SecG n=1 Tax=Candidatus Thermofonsia Clade 1 bacterium TaxID=2364210 RepID=A0A2M8PXD5_9CHLR|nr:MAG: preprotein translocase subunit SecG [Candidatus Thermofonsia Clade 1 bacterium]PJF42214.1 MAG: preprotein translocase subunit SecG [Candidatus Thermofonsia Clade 1 bacterium]RMF54135.1 MAG: preprotein translocase subunit SecG [Chloroflexota bacterium]
MGALRTALQVIQVLISIALIVLIILQAKGSGIGNLLGGGEGGLGITKTRRGLEKTLFQVTIIFAAVFLINAVIQLAIQ